MNQTVFPGKIEGVLQAPASKSVAQRAIAVASLTKGRSEVLYPGHGDDVQAAIGVCRELGARIEDDADCLIIDGGIKAPMHPLNCGESGLGIRMFSGVAATLDQTVVLTGHGSLLKRPMHMIESTLSAIGVACSTNAGYLPLRVKGPVIGGKAVVDGSQSSQALTGLLIAAATAKNDVEIDAQELKSKEYIDITIRVLKSFGVEVVNQEYRKFTIRGGQRFSPARYMVEGDWSGAAFMLVAGAVAGNITVNNLDIQSAQPDRKILDAIQLAGAGVVLSNDDVSVTSMSLSGFTFDATHCPDLFPPLTALAANCKGRSIIFGASRLKAKESDRAATLIDTFTKMGIHIAVEGDVMTIEGGSMHGAMLSSHGDHRIAMAGAIAALNASTPVTINHAEAINKSYPEFFKDLESCRMK